MGLGIGIVGLPNVGKSTLFNALSGASVLAANYPFATKDPNVGVVPVPDDRLEKLSRLYQPRKTTHAALEFVDIAGLVKGASKGEGLGDQAVVETELQLKDLEGLERSGSAGSRTPRRRESRERKPGPTSSSTTS